MTWKTIPRYDEKDKQYCFDNNGACLRRRTNGFKHAPDPVDCKMSWQGECWCYEFPLRESCNRFDDLDCDPDDNASINAERILSYIYPGA